MAEVVPIESLPAALVDASEHCRKAYPELRGKHGDDLEYIKAAGFDFIYTVPSEKEWERFQDTVKEQRTHAMKLLVLACVKYPQLDDLRSVLSRRPGVVAIVANAIGIFAGVDQEAAAKKL